MLAQPRFAHADEVDRMVADIGIPPCPSIVATLIREARADEPDFGRISTLVSADVGLAAAVLKVANSALYGGGAPLDSVRQAVMRIGMRNTVQLLTGLLLRQAFPVDGKASLDAYWESSSRIAELAVRVADEVCAGRPAERELAYTFALFRDCGTALMLCRYEDYPRLLEARNRLDRRVADLEQARYGFTHAQVGFELARSWLLNEILCLAVLHHHSFDALRGRRSDLGPTSMRLIAIGAVAESVYLLECGELAAKEVEAAAEFAMLQLGLHPTALDDFAREARSIQRFGPAR